MQANVNSLPVKVSSYGRGYNCYWRMPFKKQAKITLANESDKEAGLCYYQIDWVRLDAPPEPAMYFHARYHQEYPPKMGEPYTVFVGRGRGHYVGTVLSSQNAVGHWFGEGDDMFFIDGRREAVPAGNRNGGLLQRGVEHADTQRALHGLHRLRTACAGRQGECLPLAHRRPDSLQKVAEVPDRTPRIRDEFTRRSRFPLRVAARLLVVRFLLVSRHDRRAVVRLPAVQGPRESGNCPAPARGWSRRSGIRRRWNWK